MVNFAEIADNTTVDDIERPPLVPIGTYNFVVEKVPERSNVGQGRFDTVDFMLKVVEPTDDVDPEDIEAYGDITNVRIRHRFMFNTEDKAAFDRSLFNLKRFLEDHLEVETAGMNLNEAIDSSVGHQCLGEIKWRPDPNDPEIQYAEIKRTAPVG